MTNYPQIVEETDLIALWNKFVLETSCAGRRKSLFGKFVSEDLNSICNNKIECQKLKDFLVAIIAHVMDAIQMNRHN